METVTMYAFPVQGAHSSSPQPGRAKCGQGTSGSLHADAGDREAVGAQARDFTGRRRRASQSSGLF